ncbi:MAG: RnfH family protein [Betaproteobacteria bacterium RIFCSPLOWO2_12_FULL_65_14]|nr:MAG: RnfH family protein [Betaproteobacteria bacterium RIFCSPLOWO2_12_FULL_65_14]
MEIEVVYALPEQEDAVRVRLAPGATAADAVRASGILARHPEVDLGRNKLGVYGKVVAPQARLADGDRVEIYRPLVMDPKEARRRRALKKR